MGRRTSNSTATRNSKPCIDRRRSHRRVCNKALDVIASRNSGYWAKPCSLEVLASKHASPLWRQRSTHWNYEKNNQKEKLQRKVSLIIGYWNKPQAKLTILFSLKQTTTSHGSILLILLVVCFNIRW